MEEWSESNDNNLKEIKRLLYLSTHRGIKEADLLLGRFACASLSGFSPEQSLLYSEFLQESDWDILAWIMEGGKAPEIYQEIIRTIKNTLDL